MTDFDNISFIQKSEELLNVTKVDNTLTSKTSTRSGKALNETEAAIVIQRAWRKYIDMQVFKYYKDLIEFHNGGDPTLFMRCINPNEAKYIDSAAGIHLKFRLAGDKFPPTIYYKIFTHRPIQDICANAPRDYTKPYLKGKPAVLANTKNKLFPFEDKEGWYRRIENNGWRPVSTKHLEQLNMDFYYGVNDIRNKPIEFKHSKLLRKQDLEVKRKKTKIEWMKKMYKEGMLKAKSNDKETNMIIEEAAKNLIDTLENEGLDSIEDWEVNELLEWTNTLNFDDYVQNWNTLGTTTYSDKLVLERIKLKYGVQYERENTLTDTESPDMSMQATFPTNTPHQLSSHPLSGEHLTSGSRPSLN